VLDAEAAVAFDLVGADPAAALAEADRIVAAISSADATGHELAVASAAHRVAALALVEVPDLHAAEVRIRQSVADARRSGSTERIALAQMSLAYVLLCRGRLSQALRAADRAIEGLPESDAGKGAAQRALVLQTLGRTDEALEAYAGAQSLLERHDDRVMLAKLHHNRAALLAYRGELDRAIVDQRRAVELNAELGLQLFEGQSTSDLAWMLGMSGRIPESLRLWDDIRDKIPDDDPIAWLDRADILLRAGLTQEAVSTASRAVEWLDAQRTGWETMAAEARLGLAQALLRGGRLHEAEAHADAARAMFRAQGRPSWLALADHVRAAAQLERDGVARRAHLRTARTLEHRGWRTLALDLRVAVATAALAAGRPSLAADAVDTATARRDDPLEVRSRSHHLQALARRLDGDRAGAARHLRSGWELLDRQRALVGASELRATSAHQVVGVVAEGLRSKAADGSPAGVLDWAERGRAASLRFPPALPPDDPELAATLGRLRMLSRSQDEAALSGRPDALAARELTVLELRVVRLTRQATGVDGRPPVDVRLLRDSLADTTLVELVTIGASVVAVVVDGRRSRLVVLAPVDAVRSAVDRCEFLLRRLAAGFGGAGTASFRAAVEDLDRLLGAPLRPLLRGVDVVVSPTGPLWRVPWSSLRSLADRVVVVTPSATVWHGARATPRPRAPRVVAVAGPSLDHAPAEVEKVVSLHRRATPLTGADATVTAVTAALRRADVAHLAVHGSLRGDNPLFSSLQLADGPLMGYDLERLDGVPHTVVLPSCHSGEGRHLPGEEMLGLAWTLLGAGAASVVAATTAVPDAATAELMVRFHSALTGSASTAEALTRARSGADADDPLAVATAAAFVCVGS
jgi:tetratricopeptide (TPR) repeat protein